MEQTLDNIAYEVIELVRPNRVDDSEIDLRLVKERINDLRALFLKQELSKGRSIEQTYVQDLGTVALEQVDPIEDAAITTGTNFILRTSVDVPRPLEGPNGLLFTRIGPIDKTLPNFNMYRYEETYYNAFSRFGINQINSYYRNDRIYIFADECVDFIKLIENINIQGVFENPEDVNNDPCFETTGTYPLSTWMKENIVKTIVQEMTYKLSKPEDQVQDGTNQQ